MAMVVKFLFWGLILIGLTSCTQKDIPEVRMSQLPPSPPSTKKNLSPFSKKNPIARVDSISPSQHKIGLLLPLTGPHEKLGKGMLQAAEMALFETEASNVILLPQDIAKGSHQAALKALDEGAELLLGPIFAEDVEAIKPLLKARDVNLICFSTDQTIAGQGAFILGFLPSQQIEKIALFAKEKGWLKLAAFTPNDAYGKLVDQTLRRLESQGDIQLLGITHYTKSDLLEGNPGNSRLQEAAEIYNLKGVDALFIPEGGENLSHLLFILKSQLPLRILGSGQWDTPETFQNLKQHVKAGFFASASSEERQNFENRFEKIYAYIPPRIATLAFDATAIAVNLAEKGFTSHDLTFSEGFSGIDGLFRLNKEGFNERGLAIIEIDALGMTIVRPAPLRF